MICLVLGLLCSPNDTATNREIVVAAGWRGIIGHEHRFSNLR